MNKDFANHTVQVLHKCETITDDKNGRIGALAVGKTFRFRSGSAYTVQEDGSVRNAGPRKLTKAERKQAKRARQMDRQLATANLSYA